jgi:nitroreductase/NAD-dependent dihydropyrimidine dehydrogenase PreA subunit
LQKGGKPNLVEISINRSLCNSCKRCIICCPWNIFNEDNSGIPQIDNEELCVSCGHCIAVCEKNAISHSNFKSGIVNPINDKLIPSFEETLELIRSRRSIRAFLDKPVNDEQINHIISGSIFAPSSNNEQSTEYVIIKDAKTIEKIKIYTIDFFEEIYNKMNNPIYRNLFLLYNKRKALESIEKLPDYKKLIDKANMGNDLILHNAPVLLFLHSNKNVSFSEVDDLLKLQNAMLLSHAMGLGSFYAGYVVAACRYDDKIPRLLDIPKENSINGCIAIGYPKLKYSKWIDKKNSRIRII